jgi:hypothetical protein
LSAGNGSFHLRAGRTNVRKEIVARERLEARLVMHILTATGQNQCGQQSQR